MAETNMRNTSQRKIVLDVVRESLDHPTAETIYTRCIEKAPKISLGTVYRNLAVLAQTGEILKVPSSEGPDHYDFNLSAHHHFLCTKCGRVSDIPKEFAPSDEYLMCPKNCGFHIKGYSLLYSGICPDCLEEEN